MFRVAHSIKIMVNPKEHFQHERWLNIFFMYNHKFNDFCANYNITLIKKPNSDYNKINK